MQKNVGNRTSVTSSRSTRCRRHIPPLRRRPPCGERGVRRVPGTHEGEWCLDRSVRNGRASMRFRQHRSTRRAQARPARLLQIRRLLVLEAGVLVGELVVSLCLGRGILVGPLEIEGHVSARLHVGDPRPLRAQPYWRRTEFPLQHENAAKTCANTRVAQSRKKQPPISLRPGDEPATRLPCGGSIFVVCATPMLRKFRRVFGVRCAHSGCLLYAGRSLFRF